MTPDLTQLRQHTIENILARQDAHFRWGYDEKQARQRPDMLYYAPNFRSTLWTLVLLADLQAPVGDERIQAALRLVSDHFYDPTHGIARLPGMSHFPIPCLNGNLLYLQNYFGPTHPAFIETSLAFFSTYQRFDDGDFRTPAVYPYCSNSSCYGAHSCYWGVIKLLKGLSFLPHSARSADVQSLIANCIEFILRHEVCFRSHQPDRLLHPDLGLLTFPHFYKSDYLEILWLLTREGVRDPRMQRALDMLRTRQTLEGDWPLEKTQNTIVPIGQLQQANGFISERAREVLAGLP
jgi:hypothetical protein